jgi:hypothetical protein
VKWFQWLLKLRYWLVAFVALAVVFALAAPSVRDYIQAKQKHAEWVHWLREIHAHGGWLGEMRHNGGPEMITVFVSDCKKFSKQLIQTTTELPYTVHVFDAARRACIDDRTLAPLSTVKSLRWLSLRSTNVGTDGLPFVAGMTELERIDLAFTKIDGRALQVVAQLPNVRSLDLSYTRISNDDLVVLAGHAKLEQLDMSGVSLQPGFADVLLAIPNLRTVYMFDYDFPEDEITRLYEELDRRQRKFDLWNGGSEP